ncbi:MAG: CHAD domain-containing protein [Xanthobacteraceae bacterium]|nr:CHAD domain-containing protein [Xanthobacteraceae bacterium]
MSHKPALRPDFAVGEAMREVAHAILADARKAIDSPDNSDAVAVHEFRRAMKHWRALLRLLAPFLGDESEGLQAAARDLARDLGGARDLQSALEALQDLEEHDLPLPDRSLKTVRKRINDLRTAGEMNALNADMRLRIAQALADAEVAINRWPIRDLRFHDVAKQLAASYREARDAVPERWSHAGPEALHELRKLVVIHRYQMQVVQPLWKRFTKMWIAEAQKLRERLGEHQDLEVLRALTEPGQPLAFWHSKFDRPIDARKRRLVAAAKKVATRMFVDKPGAFRRRLIVMWKTG